VQLVVVDALVVVVDCDRQHLLGVVLPDHVLIQVRTDLNMHTTPVLRFGLSRV